MPPMTTANTSSGPSRCTESRSLRPQGAPASRVPADVRLPDADRQDGQQEEHRHDRARQDAGHVQARRRGVGHRAVDDERDARRDQVAQARAGRDRAQHHALVVVAVLERGQRHRRDGRGPWPPRSRTPPRTAPRRRCSCAAVRPAAGSASRPSERYILSVAPPRIRISPSRMYSESTAAGSPRRRPTTVRRPR